MYETSLLASTRSARRATPWWITLLSIVFEACVLAIALALPLLHPERIPLAVAAPHALRLSPPAPPPPLQARPTAATRSNSTIGVSAPAPASPVPAASRTAAAAAQSSHWPVAQTDDLPASVGQPLLEMGHSGGTDQQTLTAVLGSASTAPTVVAAARKSPVRISSGVSQGLLLSPIRPAYPAMARAAQVQGTVVLQAVISRDGTLTGLVILSGPQMLRNAALDAVQSARFRPYLLNGEPTEVTTTISVVFTLGQQHVSAAYTVAESASTRGCATGGGT